jgi:hypothetical protein
MGSQLRALVRQPATYAFVLLGVAGILAVGDGIRLVTVDATGPRAAAGFYVGAVGVVLLVLLAISIFQSRGSRPADETIIGTLADEILDEEREAGRDPSDHFSVEAEALTVREAVRVLGLAGVLVLFWIIALPFLGFAVVAGVFCLLFMRLVTHVRWRNAVIGAVLISSTLTALFSAVGVLLPRGSIWPY